MQLRKYLTQMQIEYSDYVNVIMLIIRKTLPVLKYAEYWQSVHVLLQMKSVWGSSTALKIC